ncbi:MAG: N-acetylmuramoyl-L-alanine amidase [Defluviitaleaceae bacterium]|nr:N-acetylmuramoyl-L-alanine amidase [Defluviitaleaceae bacterium]MCL2263222.1 N-acetylmuramoyl-L-alanine amidase [Defluviitaleaceae bacterium]
MSSQPRLGLFRREYRGTRGVRDFSREARELILPAFFLAGMCVSSWVLLAVLLFANWHSRRETIPAAAFQTATVFAPQTEVSFAPPPSESAQSILPVVPLSWGDGIFFDAYSGKITFPHELNATVDYIYHRRRQTVSFEGADFSRRFSSLSRYDILPMHILREGESFTFFNRYGAFVEYGETAAHSYIKLVDPRERYHTIVIIDAGHGGRDPGAPSVHRNAPYEAEIVLTISQKLLEIFYQPGVLLIPTRTCDYFLSTAARARIANAIGDYFISIHCNACSASPRSRGTLTLYGTAEGSAEIAEKFQTALIAALQSQDRGTRYAPEFRILRESQIPVVILELLFLSNPEEATRLADPATQFLIAQTIAETIENLPRAR